MGCASSSAVDQRGPASKPTPMTQPPKVPQLVGNYKGTVHDDFVRLSSLQFFGRDELVKTILDKHIATTNNAPALCLHGNSGMGKTSVLAAVARQCMAMASQNKLPKTTAGRPWRVFYHFVGSVPGSTDLLSMLRRLLFELQIIKTEWDLPSKLEDAIGLVCSALSKPSTESYIVIIDSLNQIDEINGKDATISWLPLNPAPNVRIVTSVMPNCGQFLQMKQFYSNWTFVAIGPLDIAAKRQLISSQLAAAGQGNRFDEKELAALSYHSASDNALWLQFAVEEMCRSTIDDADDMVTFVTKTLPPSLEGIQAKALERIERGPLSRICVASLCLLKCSVNGLDLEEIYEVLVAPSQLPIDLANMISKMGGLGSDAEQTMESILNQKVSIEHETWQQIEQILGFYIRMFVVNHKNRLDFFHRSFARAVKQRYKLSTAKGDTTFRNKIISSWFHNRLGNYFKQHRDAKRRCETFPIHAHRSNDLNSLIIFLANWENFDAMYDKEYSRSLNKAWTYVFDLTVKANRLKARRGNEPKPEISNVEMFKAMQETYETEVQKLYPSGHDDRIRQAPAAEQQKFFDRLERLAIVFSQNGCYDASIRQIDRLIDFTDCLGNPSATKIERLRFASFVFIKAQILDQEVKSVDFMEPSQLPKLEDSVRCFEAAIGIFKQEAPIDDRIGKGLNRLAFVYSGIYLREGSEAFPKDQSRQSAIQAADEALGFYMQQPGQQANLADCYISRGIAECNPCDAQIDCYTRALTVIIEEFGYFHPVLDRVYLNTGIYYEETGNAEKAYEFFRKWHDLCMVTYGSTHPMSLRTIRTLQEERYAKMAAAKGHAVPSLPKEVKADVESDDDVE